MANAPGGIWSDESMRKIQRDHTRLKSLVTNLTKVRPNESSDAGFMRPLVGVTGTNASYPSYPTSGDTYVVLIDDAYFTPTPGSQSRSLRGTASRYVIARTWDGSSVDEDTPVIVDPIHAQGHGWQWWIRPEASGGTFYPEIISGNGYAARNSSNTSTQIIDANGLSCYPQGTGITTNMDTATSTTHAGRWLRLKTDGWYELITATTWKLPQNTGVTSGQVGAPRIVYTIIDGVSNYEHGYSTLLNINSYGKDGYTYATHCGVVHILNTSSPQDIRYLVYDDSGSGQCELHAATFSCKYLGPYP